MSERLELFHRVADAGSARVRARVVALGVEGRIAFRNVHFDSHRERLAELGGAEVPAIWDGATLHVGEVPCVQVLDSLTASAPAE